MALTPGTRLGIYEITAAIGAGGMGEVYKARDTKLHREVAIKVLPESLASDPERLARFSREAQVLAALNHPNIAHIHGFEDSTGVPALVMELVEGPTLLDRIARGPIPIDEALPIAKQIAEALEAAHEQGIVHRDLKPANIKVTPDAKVKVLDFGLAKLVAPAASGAGALAGLSESPTLTTPAATLAGVILGTAAYMSPEQAKGRPADRRSDVWAFGCVLYEMLTGKRAFAGEDVGDTLAAVLRGEPDWVALPEQTPPSIRRLLDRALEKDPTERLPHVGVARLDIKEALLGTPVDRLEKSRDRRRRERLAWIAALGALTLIAAAALGRALSPMPSGPEARLEIVTPATTDPISLAISPDGKKIVFVATSEGRSRLWLRSLGAVSARTLVATEGAADPFWSPDSRSVGFFADGKLRRVDIDGGSAQTVATAVTGYGAAWNAQGVILFGSNLGFLRVSAAGGEPAAVARARLGFFPQFLPDGRHFIFFGPEGNGIYLAQLEGSEWSRLVDADAAAVYASPGHLLFVRQGTLLAQAFDPARLVVAGSPFPVAEPIAVERSRVAVSASNAGPIIYRTGSDAGERRFLWFDRSGAPVGTVGESDTASPAAMSLSPDGTRMALNRSIGGNTGIWLLDMARGLASRFTLNAAIEMSPLWSPDGKSIVFTSVKEGKMDLYRKLSTAAGHEELLLATPQSKAAVDWSADGRYLLVRSFDSKTGYDLWALPLQGDRKPFPIAQTSFEERDGQFSPDGQWVAYDSNESGRHEIYLQPFPGPGRKELISTEGGVQVRWRPDGKELFYIALDGRLMAVPIRLASAARTFEAGVPTPLFATRTGEVVQGIGRQQYVLSHDGQRFLMNVVVESHASPITVILNWAAGLKK